MPILPIGDRRLGAILLSSLELNETQFEQAISQSASTSKPLADSLIQLGFITEQSMVQRLQEELELPIADLRKCPPPNSEIKLIFNGENAQHWNALPLKKSGDDTLHVGFVYPLDTKLIEAVENTTQCKVVVHQVLREHYRWALALYYPELRLPIPSYPKETKQELLGQRLRALKRVTKEELQAALLTQSNTHERLGEILLAANILNETELYRILAEQSNLEFLESSSNLSIQPSVLETVTRGDVKRFKALPLGFEQETYRVLTTEPKKQAQLEDFFERPVKLVLCTPTEFDAALERFFPARNVQVRPFQERRSKLRDEFENSQKAAPVFDLEHDSPDRSVLHLIPEHKIRQFKVFPYRWHHDSLQVLISNPSDVFVLDDVQLIVGRLVTPVKATPQDIEFLIHNAFKKPHLELEQLTIIEPAVQITPEESISGLGQLELQTTDKLKLFIRDNPELIEVVRLMIREEIVTLREQLLIDLNLKARESN
jgi:Type II secretion system (T2SS), protein E, N-terminal domain